MKPRTLNDDVIYIENDLSEKSLKWAYDQKFKLYGLTKDEVMEMAEKQGFACASCGDDAKGQEHTLCVDHNHDTNEIRGLLCAGCNTAAGWLEDSPERAIRLAIYLNNSGTGRYVPYKEN